jgi:hypothetical protein
MKTVCEINLVSQKTNNFHPEDPCWFENCYNNVQLHATLS